MPQPAPRVGPGLRWLVTGAGGMLGRDAVPVLRRAGHQVTEADRSALDILDPHACLDAVRGHDVVLNCAAWTAVDDAEAHEAEAYAANAVGPANLARATAATEARLVHFSTDYVFDGTGTEPYSEDAPGAPGSAYGRTKLAGEWAVRANDPRSLVVRTAWLYGAHGSCFPRTIARLAAERDTLDVVDDQHGQPTWTVDLAELARVLVERDAPGGVYHGTSGGETTWFGFARAVVAASGQDPAMVRPTSSQAFARPAPRPSWSVLGHDALRALGIDPIGAWQDRWCVAERDVLGRASVRR